MLTLITMILMLCSIIFVIFFFNYILINQTLTSSMFMYSPNRVNVMFDANDRGMYDFGENITLLSKDPP